MLPEGKKFSGKKREISPLAADHNARGEISAKIPKYQHHKKFGLIINGELRYNCHD